MEGEVFEGLIVLLDFTRQILSDFNPISHQEAQYLQDINFLVMSESRRNNSIYFLN